MPQKQLEGGIYTLKEYAYFTVWTHTHIVSSFLHCSLYTGLPSARYRIVKIFQGRKLSRMSWFVSHPRKVFSAKVWARCTHLHTCIRLVQDSAELFSAKFSYLPIYESFLPWHFTATRYIYIYVHVTWVIHKRLNTPLAKKKFVRDIATYL